MAKIQPLTVWKDGAVRTATNLTAMSTQDDLSTCATFSYWLHEDDTVVPPSMQEVIIPAVTEEQVVAEHTDEQGNVVPEHTITVVITPERTESIMVAPGRVIPGDILVSGSVRIEGQDYDDWGTQGIGVNEEAYNYIAGKLNITLIP